MHVPVQKWIIDTIMYLHKLTPKCDNQIITFIIGLWALWIIRNGSEFNQTGKLVSPCLLLTWIWPTKTTDFSPQTRRKGKTRCTLEDILVLRR